MVCLTLYCGSKDFGNNFPGNAVIEYFGTIFAYTQNNQLQNNQSQNENPVFIIRDRSNVVGTAGFVLAFLGVFFCWAPILNWILCITRLVLSIIGCSKEPKALAITRVVISVIGFIFTIAITFSSVDRYRNELKLLVSKPILEMKKQK
ncbi:MAG: hypothetical protein LBK58_12655 [Prevotellaceae bacterium]|jgi:hypothetical protein|nr:hypothetical protein [Prevotellaceae bacterium]